VLQARIAGQQLPALIVADFLDYFLTDADRKMAACVRRSASELPPTHEARVTAYGYGSDQQLTAAHGRLFRMLRKHGCQYLAVNEWGVRGKRHLHILIRAGSQEITGEEVSIWWEKCLPAGATGTSHCAPIRDVDAFARYVFKDMHKGGELPPSEFKGKHYSASRRFFVRKLAVLWKAVRDDWDRSRRSALIPRSSNMEAVGDFSLWSAEAP
jgi:hypothetical protein